MRIVFMGTAELACDVLRALCGHAGTEVMGVVTQPDRPKGRNLKLAPSPVHAAAAALGCPVLTPLRVNSPESVQALRALRPELIVVVAYGQILGAELLALPPRGCVNVHTSLLPKYRGAAPIQWAIANGERVTGVTTMFMDAGMDTGDILMQRDVPIGPDDTAGTMHVRLAQAGAELMLETLAAMQAGTLAPRAQDPARATLAPKLRKQDGEIDWTLPAAAIYNRIRGFNPWPMCVCRPPGVTGESPGLKVLRAVVETGTGSAGEVLAVTGAGPLVAAGEGAVRLLDVQPPGGRPMPGDVYLRGHAWRVGQRLGSEQ